MDDFKFETILDFDNHISNSIYGYDLLHNLIVNISSFFIKKDTKVIDLGTTTGKLPIELNNEYDCEVIGYDIISDNFIKPKSKKVKLIQDDITKIEYINSNLYTSIFTLQFLPINDKKLILNKVYNCLNDNGAFIVCEKEYADSALIQEVFTFSNYQNKLNNFSPNDILKKEKQLRHSMNCLTNEQNIRIYKEAGFKRIDVFFQSLNFKGYILTK